MLTWGPIVDISKHDIHLVEGLSLGLWEEEEGPYGGSDHPACEEEPGSVAERLEDIRQGLGDGKLSEPVKSQFHLCKKCCCVDLPLNASCICACQGTEGTRENLCRDDPGNTIQTERPAIIS